LYIPANIYPILSITKLKQTQGYTIWAGIEDFLRTGAWPLALLVFMASMVIPFFKIASLIFMLTTMHRKSPASLLWRTRLYRLIDFIGRWSMIDIYMLSVLVGLVQFGQMAQVTSGEGAVCFAAVVIITMCAVMTFDPRLMWDEANRRMAIPNSPRSSYESPKA
jgi:paraquat-inducible protein A